MTIQMLATWGGYEEHSIQTLASQEETRLIGLGLARAYTDGQDGRSALPVAFNPTTRQLTAGNEDISSSVSGAGIPQTPWLTKIPTMEASQPAFTGTLGYSQHALWELEADWDAIQVPFFNFDTTNPQTVGLVKVAAFDSVADVRANSAAYVVAGVNGSAPTVPVGTLIAGTGGAPDRIYPSCVWSDPIYRSSLSRADGGTLPLIAIREYRPAGAGKSWSQWTPGTAGWATGARLIAARYQSGDRVTDPTTFTDNTPRSTTPFFGFRYRVRKPAAVSIMAFGDSITNGGNAETYKRAWLYKLQAALSSIGRPMEYANIGISGSRWEEFLILAKVLLPTAKPTFAIAPIWTPNSGPADIATQRASLVEFLDICRANGVEPILWEGTPRSGAASETTPYYTAEEDAAKAAWQSEAAALCRRVIKTNAGLSDGGLGRAFAAGYSTDRLHPNAAGDTALAQLMLPTFRELQSLVYG